MGNNEDFLIHLFESARYLLVDNLKRCGSYSKGFGSGNTSHKANLFLIKHKLNGLIYYLKAFLSLFLC